MASLAQMLVRSNSGHKRALKAIADKKSPRAYLKSVPAYAFEGEQRGLATVLRTLARWEAYSHDMATDTWALTEIGAALHDAFVTREREADKQRQRMMAASPR